MDSKVLVKVGYGFYVESYEISMDDESTITVVLTNKIEKAEVIIRPLAEQIAYAIQGFVLEQVSH